MVIVSKLMKKRTKNWQFYIKFGSGGIFCSLIFTNYPEAQLRKELAQQIALCQREHIHKQTAKCGHFPKFYHSGQRKSLTYLR